MESKPNKENKSSYFPIYIKLCSTSNCGVITPYTIPFNDFHSLGKRLIFSKISKINVWTGFYKNKEVISGIQFEYKLLDTSEILQTNKYKGEIGPDESLVSFELNYGEYIKYFQLWTDNRVIHQIEFITNRKREFHIGQGGGIKIQSDLSPSEDILISAFGGYNDILHSIGFYYLNVKEYKMHLCEGFLILRFILKNKEKKHKIKENLAKLGDNDKLIYRVCKLSSTAFVRILSYMTY